MKTSETSDHRRIVSLEIGRFIAAAMVTIAHLIAIVNYRFAAQGQSVFGGWEFGTPLPLNIDGMAIYAGELSVQYFFVLSGFVMATAHYNDFGKRGAAFQFWWRRACRIYPVYWLGLVIASFNGPILLGAGGIIKNLFLLPWQTNLIIFSAWTLMCEVAFYFMFGLCLLPRVGKSFLILWIVLCLWRWCPDDVLRALHLSLPDLRLILPNDPLSTRARNSEFFSYMAFYFFGGMVGGILFMRFKLHLFVNTVLLAAGIVLLALLLPPLNSYGPYQLNPMEVLRLGIIIGAICLGVAGLERRHATFNCPVVNRAAQTSYSLYILHVPLIVLLDKLMSKERYEGIQLYLIFFAVLVLIYFISAVITFAFDQPVQRFLRSLFTAPRSKPSTVIEETNVKLE